jgi:myo-inositol-1(or 4)-monophosphatase
VTKNQFEIGDLAEFALNVIREAGRKSLSFYGRGKPGLKFDDQLVTQAEIDLTDFFQTQLAKRFPEHQIFNTSPPDDTYTHDAKRYMWIFDPLDGVANFQAGIPIWGLSVALLENYWPIFGAFYMPATNNLCYGLPGKKAYWDEKAISVSPQAQLSDESLFLTYSRFHHYYHSNFPGKIRNLGCTAAHICYVAMGRAEAAVLANESYHDLAAAHIIIESAGGKIFNLKGEPFFPNQHMDGQRIEDHLIVTSPQLYKQIRDCLKKA